MTNNININNNKNNIGKIINTPIASSSGGMLLLLTLAIGFVMAMIDVTAVNVALPDISLNLSIPLTGLVWVVDGYTLTFAALLLAGGALADRFGPKNVYQAGLGIFILGSILCGAAPNGSALIAARLLQGLGAAMFMPSSLSLLTHAYEDDKTRAKMVGIWSAMVGGSSAIGPLVGGILVHGFGWRSVFWINIPIGLLGIALAQILIAPTPKHARDLSILSHALGVLILSALSFFLIEGPALGWFSPYVVSAAVITIVAISALIWRERTGSHPLLPAALFETSGFAAANLTGFLINFALFGQLFMLSLYLQQARDADALGAGIQLLPMMAAITVGNLLSGRISARVGSRASMLGGMIIATIAALFLMATKQHSPYIYMIVGIMIVSLAVGIAIPAMTTTVMQISGRAHANSAAAALNANRQIGALVGVALIGTILHTVPGWDSRLALSFGAFAIAYGIAGFSIFRFIAISRPKTVAVEA